MGGEKLKWHQLAHYQLMSQQQPHFNPHRKAKVIDKRPNLRKIGNYSGISHVTFASVLLGENASEEVDDYDNYYYE